MTERELRELSRLLKKLESEVRAAMTNLPQPPHTKTIQEPEDNAQRVKREIHQYPLGIKARALHRKFRAIRKDEMRAILTALVQSGSIYMVKLDNTGGRPARLYRPAI